MQTEQIILRHFQPTDLEDFFNYTKLESVTIPAGYSPNTTLKQAQKHLEKLAKNPNSYAIEDKKSHTVIGYITIHNDSEQNLPTIKELGFVLSPSFQRKGIMTQAITEILRFLFENGIECVYACCIQTNTASKNLIEKIGFVFDKEGFFTSDSLHTTFPSYEYFMTHSKWKALQNRST